MMSRGSFYTVGWKLSLCVGILMIGFCVQAAEKASGALDAYVEKEDGKFAWEIHETAKLDGVTVYDLTLTSQQWREYLWKHQLTLFVPDKMLSGKTALLFVTGGSIKNGVVNRSSLTGGDAERFSQLAMACGAPAAVLKQTPNQPLFGDMHEDEIISHTFDQYLKSNDPEWPLLLPMVKSAVKAMDALTELSKKEMKEPIEKFVISGGSKRGWTTWLTGAYDSTHEKRVAAIAPMVIDVLNMKPQMDYQLVAWDEYSVQIQDYTEKGIQQKMSTDEGADLLAIVDPYYYRDRLTMPKLIFIGCNDPYWPVDAIKFYWDDLKGEKYIHYVPNAGHDLGGGEQAIRALAGFFAETAHGKKHPKVEWKLTTGDGKAGLTVSSEAPAQAIRVWFATSSDRDFRNNLWQSQKMKADSYTTTIPIPYPKKGYLAAYGEVEFQSEASGEYTKTTRMFVFDANGSVD
ncbi:MAG: PhoPQ-activated protein PqaA family protein [Candidatus Hinthialibacter antarcticus]|nr:PhoPQ-activated protein PqaA family protein [Candidatus Hinthialibacter antarcticus]